MNAETESYPPLSSIKKGMWMLGGRGRGTLYGLIDSGEIESVKSGNRRLIVTASLLAYIERLKAQS